MRLYPETIATAWLHDTVEDTTATDRRRKYTLQPCQEHLKAVSQMVMEVTDDSRVRLVREIAGASRGSLQAGVTAWASGSGASLIGGNIALSGFVPIIWVACEVDRYQQPSRLHGEARANVDDVYALGHGPEALRKTTRT